MRLKHIRIDHPGNHISQRNRTPSQEKYANGVALVVVLGAVALAGIQIDTMVNRDESIYEMPQPSEQIVQTDNIELKK